MVNVTCYVADFNLTAGHPVVEDFVLQGRTVGSYFSDASGSAQLNVVFDWSRRGQFPDLIDPAGVREEHLMSGLSQLLGPDGSSNRPTIGLFLADSFAPSSGQFGLMFDLDGQEESFGPRQGCAVFLSAISLAIQDAGLDRKWLHEFIAFTTIHELGHAFNLWHLDGSSFMQPHPTPAELAQADQGKTRECPYNFDVTQAQYLALAADPRATTYVLPGVGRSQFGIRPHGWPSGGDHPFEGPARRAAPGIDLKIGLSHNKFWPFEPVELDVELKLASSRAKSVLVPDEVDPGYPSFQIWITRPDGERFRFRPQTRFCRSNGHRKISREEPFRRDISIFRQSGGYTFSAPGRHRIQAAFQLRSGQFILSNVAECEVSPADPKSAAWVSASTHLDTHEARVLLRYKRRAPPHHAYAQLARFANEDAPAATSSAIHYALGKALINSAAAAPEGVHVTRLRRRAAGHLRQALDRGQLSSLRTGVATTLLETLKMHHRGVMS